MVEKLMATIQVIEREDDERCDWFILEPVKGGFRKLYFTRSTKEHFYEYRCPFCGDIYDMTRKCGCNGESKEDAQRLSNKEVQELLAGKTIVSVGKTYNGWLEKELLVVVK